MYDMCAEAMLHEMQRSFAVALAFVRLEALMQSKPILLDAMSCSIVEGWFPPGDPRVWIPRTLAHCRILCSLLVAAPQQARAQKEIQLNAIQPYTLGLRWAWPLCGCSDLQAVLAPSHKSQARKFASRPKQTAHHSRQLTCCGIPNCKSIRIDW